MNTPIRTSRTKKRGFTLTEIAIVLGIVGLILGAIWVAAAAVYNNLRTGHANTEILQVAQGVRTLMTTAQTVGAAGDITTSMISAGVIPADAISSPTTAIGPWAGSTLKILSVAAADNAFTIELNAIPQGACISLLTTVGGASRDPNLTKIGGTSASAPSVIAAAAGTALVVSNAPIATAVTAAAAATACSAATSVNTVQFEFSLK
jgi:prepilin-type N-terminal cleavage/methylation domain-containing protein